MALRCLEAPGSVLSAETWQKKHVWTSGLLVGRAPLTYFTVGSRALRSSWNSTQIHVSAPVTQNMCDVLAMNEVLAADYWSKMYMHVMPCVSQ